MDLENISGRRHKKVLLLTDSGKELDSSGQEKGDSSMLTHLFLLHFEPDK